MNIIWNKYNQIYKTEASMLICRELWFLLSSPACVGSAVLLLGKEREISRLL